MYFTQKTTIISLFLGLTFGIACQTAAPLEPSSIAPDFFSLKNFMTQQIEELHTKQTRLRKSAALKEQTEEKIIETVNWKEELTLFSQSDINKAAWRDKYKVDSTQTNGQIQLIYTALEEKLKTQQLKVNLSEKNQQLLQLNITNQTSNVIYTTTENLVYKPNESYTISIQQKIMGQSKEEFVVKGTFINKDRQ